MKRFLLASAAIAGLCGWAAAADLAYKTPVVAPPPAFNWTGIYVGGFVGGAAASKNANSTEPLYGSPPAQFYNAPGADNNYSLPSSVTGGFTAGINYQPRGSNLLVGVEGEAGYLHLYKSVVDVNSLAFGSDSADTTKLGDFYGVAAIRVGAAFDRLLIYGKGGAAFVEKSANFFDGCGVAPCSVNKLINIGTSGAQLAWTAGGGIEYAFADNWSIKGEYLYLATGETYTYSGPSTNNAGTPSNFYFTSTHTDPGIHTAKIGVSYRWGGPTVP